MPQIGSSKITGGQDGFEPSGERSIRDDPFDTNQYLPVKCNAVTVESSLRFCFQ